MASRHQSRVVVLQSLFEMDFRENDKNDYETILNHNIEEFYKDDADKVYAKDLLDGILKKQKDELRSLHMEIAKLQGEKEILAEQVIKKDKKIKKMLKQN